jgi:hypothetical protein
MSAPHEQSTGTSKVGTPKCTQAEMSKAAVPCEVWPRPHKQDPAIAECVALKD